MAWDNLPAEQAVIGGLILEPDRYHDVVGRVTAEDFSRPVHRLIFRAIQALAAQGAPLDLVTLEGWLEKAGKLEQAGGYASLATLAKNTPSAANVTHYADLVRETAQRRSLRDAFANAAQAVQEADLGDFIGDLASRAESIAAAGSGSLAFSEAFTRTVDYIDENAQAREKGGVVGVPTGLPAIDQRTGGLQSRRLIVLAARPSLGKTALANQIALHAAGKGYPVGIISLEMGAEELTIRAMAHQYGLNVTRLSFGDQDELSRFSAAMRERNITDLPIWMDTETSTLGGIVARLSEWRRQHGIGLGIVDHIGLIEGGDSATRNDWLGKVSRTLKLTAKRLNMPILAVSQLNRNVERDKRRPVLADLRDSGNVEQDADICIFLHAEGDPAETANGIPIEIGLLKNRIGRRGWLSERFTFNGKTQTFREVIQEVARHSENWQSGQNRAAMR